MTDRLKFSNMTVQAHTYSSNLKYTVGNKDMVPGNMGLRSIDEKTLCQVVSSSLSDE